MPGPTGRTTLLQLPYPIPDDNVDVPRDIKALAEAVDPIAGKVPIGAMMMWPSGVAPASWLLCVGQTNIASAQYPELAAILGEASGFINMPNLQGRFPLGPSSSYPLKQAGGAESVVLTEAQMPAHIHPNNIVISPGGAHAHQPQDLATKWPVTNEGAVVAARRVQENVGAALIVPAITSGNWASYSVTDTAPAHIHGKTGGVQSTGGGQSHDNMPPYFVINFIIRAS